MLILRSGLYVAMALALYTTWASSNAGYPIETAMLRGLLAFMAGSFVAYLAELVVMTAPVKQLRDPQGGAGENGAHDRDDEASETASAPGAGRASATDERRAA